MSNLTPAQVAAIAYQAGFRGAALINAVAVSLAEDGSGNPNAQCLNCAGVAEDSRGLWQINVNAHPQYNNASIYDPLENAKAAFAISNSGTDFSPWSTWPGAAMALIVQAANAVASAGIVVAGNGPQPILPGLPGNVPVDLPTITLPTITVPGSSDVAKAGQGVVDAFQQLVKPVTSFIGNITSFLSFIADPKATQGVLMIGAGLLITLLGIVLFGLSLIPKGTRMPVPIPV